MGAPSLAAAVWSWPWTPQAVPYQGVGPDGRPITMSYSPTYVFTYTIGPPVLAAATVPVAAAWAAFSASM